MADWWIDESRALSTEEAWEATQAAYGFEEARGKAPLAVLLRDATIHETKKWFGGADIRLDALFVTATAEDQIYRPLTFPFTGIRDHDDLPIGEAGLLLYLGRPRYFLDMSLIASRSEGDDKMLDELLSDGADEVGDLAAGVAQLTYAAPEAAAITTAAAAAAKIAATALRLLKRATGNSIGLYRTTWFEHRDSFGLGRHPREGDRFRIQDFEFRYEIFQDTGPE